MSRTETRLGLMYFKIETYNQANYTLWANHTLWANYTLWANHTLLGSENRSTDKTVGKLCAGKLYTLVGKENSSHQMHYINFKTYFVKYIRTFTKSPTIQECLDLIFFFFFFFTNVQF